LGTPIKHLRVAKGIGLDSSTQYLRCTTSANAGNGLGFTINDLRGAASNNLDAIIKYLRRTTSAAASIGLGTTAKYLQRTTSGAAGSGRAERPSTCYDRRSAARTTA
jgi:hypothetical protein